jgi:hypothetical protein
MLSKIKFLKNLMPYKLGCSLLAVDTQKVPAGVVVDMNGVGGGEKLAIR